MHKNRGFTLIELMIVVAILGILAVVAIPAFVRYMRHAKTAEAYRMMNKIAMGQERYYVAPHFDDKGQPIPCMFAYDIGQPETPLRGTCCTEGEPDGKCEPNETRWNTAAWQAILFKISDKHYYSYDTDSPDAGKWIGVFAFGDLDCDGTYSSFFLRVSGSREAPGHINCRTSKFSSTVVVQETE